jgi:hypothetical protein
MAGKYLCEADRLVCSITSGLSYLLSPRWNVQYLLANGDHAIYPLVLRPPLYHPLSNHAYSAAPTFLLSL